MLAAHRREGVANRVEIGLLPPLYTTPKAGPGIKKRTHVSGRTLSSLPIYLDDLRPSLQGPLAPLKAGIGERTLEAGRREPSGYRYRTSLISYVHSTPGRLLRCISCCLTGALDGADHFFAGSRR